MIEYGIQRLIPPWSTNPALPPGQPYPGEPNRIIEGPFRDRSLLDVFTADWAPGTWRVMQRTVTDWQPTTTPAVNESDDTPWCPTCYSPATTRNG